MGKKGKASGPKISHEDQLKDKGNKAYGGGKF